MLRIAFAGTPEFAARALSALIEADRVPVLVLTQPDRPAGRGRALQASPVKALALSHGIEVWQPASLRDPLAQRRFAEVALDAMVVAAYGLILPEPILSHPRFGCLNIHASLLPRWRGAAPIQRAIEAGDRETGITIMQMDAGLDTGPMLSSLRTPILPEDTGGSVHDRLAELGGEAIVAALDELENGRLQPMPQPAEGVTYAHKLGRDDTQLDFAAPARVLVDRVRAFDPVPGSVAAIRRGEESVPVKFWRLRQSSRSTQPAPPGTVLRADAQALLIACGDGVVDALELQKPGGRRLARADFLRGFPIAAGDRFLLPPSVK